MSLVTIAAQDISWNGVDTPVTAKLIANQSFTTSENVRILAGDAQPQQFACSIVANKIRITSGSAYTTTDSDVSWGTYTLNIYSSRGKIIATPYTNIRIPATPASTNWTDLDVYSNSKIQPFRHAYYDVDATERRLAQLQLAPLANDTAIGRVKLDTTPLSLSDPIAVGSNSNRIEKNLSSDYSNSFATAITSIGAANVTLVVKNPVTVTANTTIPANILLDFTKSGLITINTGVTLTIGSMVDPGNRQVFVQADATANIRFTKGSVEKMNVAWLLGSTGTLCTNAINQYIANSTANGSGTIYLPEGAWTTAGGHIMPSQTRIVGDGNGSIAGQGSRITATGAGTGVFIIPSNTYFLNFKDIVISGGGFAIAAVICQGTVAGGATGQIRFEAASLRDALYGLRIQDTVSTEWQVAAVSFDSQCRFSNNTEALSCNTSNNVLKCDAFFEVGANQSLGTISRTGQWTFNANEFAGSFYVGVSQFESQTVAGSVTVTGIAQSVVAAAGMPGTPVTVSVPVDTTMTTGTLIAAAFRSALGADPSVLSFFHIGGTGAEVQLIALDPAAPDAGMNFTIATGTATGVTPSATSTLIANGVADTTQANGFNFTGVHGHVTFIGTVDEGFRNFIISSGGDVNSPINFVGSTIQAPIRLNGQGSLNTTSCLIADKVVRNSVGADVQYQSVGDVVIEYNYFAGAFRTMSPRSTHNFNGVVATGGSCMEALVVNQFEERVNQQYTHRLYQNDTGVFRPRTKAQLEVMSSVDPAGGTGGPNWPMVRVGQCTSNGEPLFYYDVYRDYATGWLNFKGSQSGFQRYVFDAFITTPALSINGGTSLATTNQTGTGSLVMSTTPTLVTPVIGAATGTSLALGGGTALATTNRTGTGNLVLNTTPTLITPIIGVATGTSLAVTGLLTSSGTAGVGYATGAGGSGTQATNKATTVVLNKICGQVTLNNANLVAGTIVSFTLTNSTIALTDVIILNHVSGGSVGAYLLNAQCGAGSATINVRNTTADDLAEAIVISFVVIKGVTA